MPTRTLFRLSPLKIAGVYLVFGLVWVASTDWLVILLFESPDTIALMQTVKGWAFVGLSALLILGLTSYRKHQTDETRETLQAASEQLQVLHRVLRHNIRNDLNVVQGHLDMLDTDDDRSHGHDRRHIRTARQKAERITEISDKMRIVNDIAVNGEIEEIDLVTVVAGGVNTVRRWYPEAEIEVNAPQSAPIEGDPALERAVIELLENAIEHGDDPPDDCEIVVDLARKNGHVVLAVTDSGPAIPQHELDALEAGTESDLLHMSGVGLWVVKWLCEYHHGELSIESEPETGTTVSMRFESADRIRMVPKRYLPGRS